VGVDSRQARPGQLFFALQGEHADGHAFLGAVAAAGAYAVVRADYPVGNLPAAGFCLRVDDPLAALGRFAMAYRAQMSARIAGVTGSVGKTATKELLADALATLGPTVRTAGNFNNEIGLPLSLTGLGRHCVFGVFEVGISHPGETAPLRDILRPDFAVMTRIGAAHIGFFESVGAIAEEKAALLERLPPDGFAVLGRDDDCFAALRAHASAPVVTCSLRSPDADYAGVALADDRLRVQERDSGEQAVLPVPPPAAFMAENVLKAVAAARRCGVPWPALEAALAAYVPVGMRWAVQDVCGWTAINDGYNANPESMCAALRAFADWRVPGRRFLALGPMLELGRHERPAHEALGRLLAAGGWAGVAIVPGKPAGHGDAAARALSAGLRNAGWAEDNLIEASDHAAAAAWLRSRLRPGDALLLKASRAVRIEMVLDELQKGV